MRSKPRWFGDKFPLTYDVVENYHAHPAYIEALKASVLKHWQVHGRPDFTAGDVVVEKLLGSPGIIVLNHGDPIKTRRCSISTASGEYGQGFDPEMK